MIFLRPQWRSWLVRGGFIIGAFGLVVAAHLVSELAGADRVAPWLGIAGGPLALMTAIYTGYLFAQAKGRDLWQNPLLPPHFAVQAAIAGSAVLFAFAPLFEPGAGPALAITLGVASLVHLLMIAGEATLGHATAHASLAMHELVAGKYRAYFWSGIVLAIVTVFAYWTGPIAGAFGLLAILAYEHGYVQAGQMRSSLAQCGRKTSCESTAQRRPPRQRRSRSDRSPGRDLLPRGKPHPPGRVSTQRALGRLGRAPTAPLTPARATALHPHPHDVLQLRIGVRPLGLRRS